MPERGIPDGPEALSQGAPERRDPQGVAARLGISHATLEAYLQARGGAPDGGAALVSLTVRYDVSLVTHALPAPRSPVAPWVKRDRPRFFMPG
jgi:hypothetical protein